MTKEERQVKLTIPNKRNVIKSRLHTHTNTPALNDWRSFIGIAMM